MGRRVERGVEREVWKGSGVQTQRALQCDAADLTHVVCLVTLLFNRAGCSV